MSKHKRTTDDILADLYARRDSLAEGGRPVTVAGDINQQIIGHETLARLRDERAELVKADESTVAVDTQLAFWRRQVDEDAAEVPEPVAEPGDLIPPEAVPPLVTDDTERDDKPRQRRR